MSRIGKQPIEIPDKIKIELEGQDITITGPKGQLAFSLPRELMVKKEGNRVVIEKTADSKKAKSLWGTWRSILNNAVLGVSQGFQKQLELVGIGFRGVKKEEMLELSVGYSHSVEFKAPDDIDIQISKNIITVSGIDRQKVGEVSAKIRSIRPPEPYKGKGIRYLGEEIKLKAGKVAKAVGGVGK